MSCYRIAIAISSRHGQLASSTIRSNFTRYQEFITKRHVHNGAERKEKFNTVKLTLLGTAIGAAAGTISSMYNLLADGETHKEHKRTMPKVIHNFPEGVRITKRFVNTNDRSGLNITLFQFQTCPFCCKVRAYLDYKKVSYSVVEVDAVLRQDIKWSSIKKVPMVLIKQNDGQFIQMSDSSAIISLIASVLNDPKINVSDVAQFYPNISYFDDNGKKTADIMNKYFLMYQEHTPKNMTKDFEELERKWRIWVDNHLVHLISPNCYQTIGEAFDTFEWFSHAGEWDVHFPKWERVLMVYFGAGAMWAISKMLKRRHQLTDDVRSHIYDALDKWMRELRERKTKFMGGNEPGLSDLAVFGVLSSMEGCKAFEDCLVNTTIGEWFFNVKEIVQSNRGTLHRERIESNSKSLA